MPFSPRGSRVTTAALGVGRVARTMLISTLISPNSDWLREGTGNMIQLVCSEQISWKFWDKGSLSFPVDQNL